MNTAARQTPEHGSSQRHLERVARRLFLCVFISLIGVGTGGGCTIIGAAAAKLAPDPTMPAQYVPAKDPTLVLVENYHNPASLRLEGEAIAREIMADLKATDVAPLIDPEDAAALRRKLGGDYRKMPLDAIGKAVGAKQVIYVDLERFEITHAIASELFAGEAAARVRIIDDTGTVLWPKDSAGGYPLAVKVQPQHTAQGVPEDTVRQQLTTELAERVGKLFHPWQAESSDGAAEQFSN